MGHLLDFQSHDKAPRGLTLTDICSEGKIPSENSTCDTQRMTTFSAPSLFAALRERSSYSLHLPPMASHWREPALEPWHYLCPGRIQVQVQQRHDDQKHQPDDTSISHTASPPTTGLPDGDWGGRPVVDDRHSTPPSPHPTQAPPH